MKYLIATVIMLLSTQNLFAQDKCVGLFSTVKTEAVPTQQSSEEAEILKKLEALVKSSIDIQLNNFENPAQLQQAKEQVAQQLTKIIAINRKYLDVFKTMRDQKSSELITTSNEKSRKEREEKKEKEEKVKEALDPINFHRKIIFYEILPGTFNMLGAVKPVTITKAYELAQTQTTQLQYSVINILLGKTDPNLINPSYFKTGSESEIITIKGIDVQMKPDHPVEQVSHDDITEWITGLNKLSKEGNDEVQKVLQKVIPGHKKGMVYDLPTEVQWAFVMQNRGKNNEIFFDRTDDKELGEYAHYSNNSRTAVCPNGCTYVVATKKPRKIDRGDGTIVDFYDLEGNVSELNKDGYAILAGGNDPQGLVRDTTLRVIRGGSWISASSDLRAVYRGAASTDKGYNTVGFRLSRTGP